MADDETFQAYVKEDPWLKLGCHQSQPVTSVEQDWAEALGGTALEHTGTHCGGDGRGSTDLLMFVGEKQHRRAIPTQ